MKCQRCPKPATLHITDVLPGGGFDELHLCEDCAKKHLTEPAAAKKGAKAAADPAARQCDQCGLKFVEFRNSGRLGCPHDYDAFKDELLPLLDSVHGDATHAGKVPRRPTASPGELTNLKKKLSAAVAAEDYELAARLRDQIRRLGGD